MVEIEYKAIKEEFVPIAKAKDILNKIEEKTYEQKLAFEHAKKFSKKKITEVKKVIRALEALEIRKLKADQIIKIADLMPKDVEDLKIILQHAEIPFKDEELPPIIEAIKSVK